MMTDSVQSKPQVSFIITAFNRPLALRGCLTALQTQTVTTWEAIVVDNSDSTRDSFANEVAAIETNVKYRRTTSETRIVGALHKYSLYKATEIGIAHTTGEWLCFPNDDSYYCPWFLERMLQPAEANGWDLVYCDLVAGGPREHHPMRSEPKRCQIDKTNFLLRRSWFQSFDHDPENYPMADGLLIESLIARGIRHGHVGQTLVVHN